MATGRLEFVGAAPATGLNAGIAAGDLSITLLSGTGYPTGAVGKFTLALDPNTPAEEHVLCTVRSGATVTIDAAGRGYDNTSAQSHSAGTTNVEHIASATALDDANAHTYVTSRDDHTQYSRTDGTRAVTGTQGFVNTTNSGTLAVTGTAATGPLTVTGAIVGTSTVQGTAHTSTLTGTNGRFVGNTNLAPSSGTYLTGDHAADPTNGVVWICTAGGTPGTWVSAGSPSTYSVEAHHTLTTAIPSNVFTLIPFNTIDSDTGSHFTSGATAKYTCPVAGRYLVTLTTSIFIAAHTVQSAVFKNGAIVGPGGNVVPATQDALNQASQTVVRVRCAANDTLQGYIQQTSVGSVNLVPSQYIAVDYLGS